MKQAAVIEFSGDWDKDSMQECLGLFSVFNYGPNQGLEVVILTEEGTERVLETITPKVDRVWSES